MLTIAPSPRGAPTGITSGITSQPRSFTLGVGHVQVRIEGLPTMLRSRLRALLAPFVTRGKGAPAARIVVREVASTGGWSVVCEGQPDRGFNDSEALLKYLEWLGLTQAVGAITDRVAIHAAALTRGPSTLVLLGKSGEGKTTLTLGLMSRGWLPLADDLVLVDPATLAIQAFPRCFHLDDATRAMFADQVSLEWPGKLEGYARPTEWAAGGKAATTIVLANRCPTCMAARFPLMQAEGAGALLAEAAAVRVSASEVAATAARMAAQATCFRLKNGPLEGSLNLIERACEG